MQVPVSEAKARLTDLVRRAEAGDEVILTGHGQPAVRLVPVAAKQADGRDPLTLIRNVQDSARTKITPGPSAARSQDFLYDEDGLPA